MINVLVVDDDSVKARAISSILRSAGVDREAMEHVTNGRDARRLLRSRCYDLVLIDVAIPDSIDSDVDRHGGIELLRDLYSQDAYYPPACAIGVTGFEELVTRAREEFAAVGVSFVYYDPASTAWQDAIQNAARTCMRRQKNAPPRSHIIDLAIVCALREPELRAVLDNGWKWTEHHVATDHWLYHAADVEGGGRRFTVRACSCPRMGTEAATIAAMKMIEHFRPRYLAMTGIAAGVIGRGNPGDVIAADPAWNWGCGKWVRRGEESDFQPAPHHLPLDAGLRAALDALGADAGLLANIKDKWRPPKPASSLQLLIGPMASGASVLADPSIPKLVKEQHRKLSAIEMEAYGIFAAAAEAGEPRPIPFALKSVVDFGDEAKADDWQGYGAYTSASVLTAFVERHLVNLCRR
jgi:CheY-like chemotaxis protein/nucleoside phosphorylase